MPQTKTTYQNQQVTLGAVVSDYLALAKHKLNLIVVITALMGFAFAGGAAPGDVLWLFLGGFLITASANTINQIIEKDFDKLMNRTKNRPLPTGRVKVIEAWLFAGITGVLGTLILWVAFNQLAALIGVVSLLSYAFIYTPLKRIHPIAVFVGAFPGALPPMIGYVAATGVVDTFAIVLFLFQFLWQFPHFWAIGWLGFEDYKKAGFKLLPGGQKSKRVAMEALAYTLILVGFAFVPFYFNMTSIWASIFCCIAAMVYSWPAYKLLKTREDKYAKQLMFASFFYLPIVFAAIIIG